METYYIDVEYTDTDLPITLYKKESNIDEEKELNKKAFREYEEVVTYIKEKLTKIYIEFKVVDIEAQGDIVFKEGKVVSIDSYQEFNDKWLEGYWLDEEQKSAKKEYKIKCDNCKDGGCIFCEPSRFL